MEWSPQQDDALQKVNNWIKDSDQQVFRLFGYAGTGKTTLAKHLAEGVEGSVLFGAFTGKAAYVLREKGCEGATTIHSLIYHTKEKGRAKLKELEAQLVKLMQENSSNHKRISDLKKLVEEERKNLSRPTFTLNTDSDVKYADLVIIDECSMVDSKMGEDLLSFGTKILVLGDPAQLPPILGGGFFTEDHEPDMMLTDIHRQARENPIIEMATKTRLKQSLSLGNYGSSRIINRKDISPEEAMGCDQILVGRNATRHEMNNKVRKLKGINENHPVPQDRLVCLRNDHEVGLLNGAIWHAEDIGEVGEDRIIMTITPDVGEEALTVEAHMHHFQGREKNLAWYERKEAQEFDYGYALTVHKAQGSQWDNVFLFDEAYCFRDDKWRWLYTGLTRAAENVTVVRM